MIGVITVGCDSSQSEDSIGGTYEGNFRVFQLDTTKISIDIPKVEVGAFEFSGFLTQENQKGEVDMRPVTGSGVYGHPDLSLIIIPDPAYNIYVETARVENGGDAIVIRDSIRLLRTR